jgi:hypothetical protein
MQRAYYSQSLSTFLQQTPDEILGEITRNNEFALEQKQRNTWIYEMQLLQDALAGFTSGGIAFEYTIPRIGDRIDNVFIYGGVVYLIEFKVGERSFPQYAREQVLDYALDLKYFHKESQTRKIVPILVCTHAGDYTNHLTMDTDGVSLPVQTNATSLKSILQWLAAQISDKPLDFITWLESKYMPTPTIIEAAQALYRGHSVEEISRSDSEAYNLSLTSASINEIIDYSKSKGRKAICFVTGVPGAGKTLAGLNIANTRQNFAEDEHAVFLSGNGPLVIVLREALARDEYERSNHTIRKKDSYRKASAFIQNIHHFRDAAIKDPAAPAEKVAIFDEAQRAWTMEQTARFMADRDVYDWEMSEPEFLISVMDRHTDWSVIVCLVGGGQEINTGEAGLPAWFDALRHHFPSWQIFVSQQISDDEYRRGYSLKEMFHSLSITTIDHLHLATSIRSFRSEYVSAFVKDLLDIDIPGARSFLSTLAPNYPIVITRNLSIAKKWVRTKARGSERYGIVASSGAKRLRNFGIWVQSEIDAKNWFLNDKDDVRSSYFLEETATEFDIQGLEVDWTIVAWDADFRFVDDHYEFYKFTGSRWNCINKEEDRLYLKNAYRVLLTRARQGMIIFIPHGDDKDETRKKVFYDETYQYLKSLGIPDVIE